MCAKSNNTDKRPDKAQPTHSTFISFPHLHHHSLSHPHIRDMNSLDSVPDLRDEVQWSQEYKTVIVDIDHSAMFTKEIIMGVL